MSIERTIKEQYAKEILTHKDWHKFRTLADYYFKNAAFLKKKDIDIDNEFKLLCRNIQKRLFIGIGTEMLLKAVYLKNRFCINKPLSGPQDTPRSFKDISKNSLDKTDTYTLAVLIDNLKRIFPNEDITKIKRGLNIAKVFRNKEGHVVALWHDFDPENYSDIELSITEIYRLGFDEGIEYKISMEPEEKAIFKKVKSKNSN